MNEGQSTRDGEELAFLREGLTPLPLLFSLEELKKVGGGKDVWSTKLRCQ